MVSFAYNWKPVLSEKNIKTTQSKILYLMPAAQHISKHQDWTSETRKNV